jgi:hypothetical protein
VAIPAGSGNPDLPKLDSGDAFSASYAYTGAGSTSADQAYMRLDPGFLRRVLLQVLDREEYPDVVRHHNARQRLELKSELPKGKWPTLKDVRWVEDPDPRAQVRITDLRLANDLTPVALRRELRTLIGDLQLPVTTDSVTRWKYETLKKHKILLKKPHEWSTSEDREERVRIMVVSFSAAALLLLFDLDMRRLGHATHNELSKLIEALRKMIEELMKDFNRHVEKLRKLLEASKGGQPRRPELKYYTALLLYRMGRPLKQIARRVGITPPPDEHEEPRKYNKNWKNQLCKTIERGVEIEKAKFPRAAAVLARRNDESVRAKALKTYRDYLDQQSWAEAAQYLVSAGIGDDLLEGMPVDESQEIYRAYVQLGSCLENKRDPIPLRSDRS